MGAVARRSCFTCEPCRRGDLLRWENGDITGMTCDGGYTEYVTVPAEGVLAVPESLDGADAAPVRTPLGVGNREEYEFTAGEDELLGVGRRIAERW